MAGSGEKLRVAVAMSGGVDSSVTAALLLAKGYDVLGITMQVCHPAAVERGAAQIPEHVADARRVAEYLKIEHHTVDFADEFRERVVDDFVSEYVSGRTPNPCVRCNKWIKFGLLQQRARALGAVMLATGHYARVIRTHDATFELRKGVDERKDQSYFLFALTQEQLSMALFPLGDLTKTEVRRLAAEFGLPVKDKGESQEICFIPDNDYVGFLEKTAGVGGLEGDIVDIRGKVLGKHGGTYRYTVGQRKGLGISHPEPLYVLSIDAATRRVVVGPMGELSSSGLRTTALNWIIPPSSPSIATTCKIRYRHHPVPCEVHIMADGKAEVRFARPERSVTPGQSVVFYENDLVLGGGCIEERC
jgi:tRNA-specific 2-thiouridylase